MSHRHHVVFDNRFSTVIQLRAAAIPSNWEELYDQNSFHVYHDETTEDRNMNFLFEAQDATTDNEGGMNLSTMMIDNTSVNERGSVANERGSIVNEGEPLQHLNIEETVCYRSKRLKDK